MPLARSHDLCPNMSSVFCPLSSVLCPLSSVLCPLSSVLPHAYLPSFPSPLLQHTCPVRGMKVPFLGKDSPDPT